MKKEMRVYKKVSNVYSKPLPKLTERFYTLSAMKDLEKILLEAETMWQYEIKRWNRERGNPKTEKEYTESGFAVWMQYGVKKMAELTLIVEPKGSNNNQSWEPSKDIIGQFLKKNGIGGFIYLWGQSE